MLYSKFKIPGYIEKILLRFEDKGYEAFLVGGCVRDFIFGKKPLDYDMATNASPQQVKEIFNEYIVVETGIEHGTVTIVMPEGKTEVTTYRIDGKYTDGRRPQGVFFTDTIEQDLARRDFTINAMAYSHARGLIDPYGGINDISNRKIKCVGNPEKRFNEDYLRILRGVRFAAVTGFELDKSTGLAMKALISKITSVATERIREEFIKILCGKYAAKSLLNYREFIEAIIPEIGKSFDFCQNNPYHVYDVYRHTIEVLINTPAEKNIRLAAFFHDIGKPYVYTEDEKGIGHFYGHGKISVKLSKEIMARLKFDNETVKIVSELVKYHDRDILPEKKAVKKFLSKSSVDLLRKLLVLKKADISGQNPSLKYRIEEINRIETILEEIIVEDECFSLKNLKINGNDLIKLGIKPGRKIGEILNDCLNKVIEDKVPNSCNELIDYVKITHIARGDGSSDLFK